MKSRLKSFIPILILIPITSLAQRVQPAPAIGWDSLKARIEYPGFLQRAGVEGSFTATIDIDSTGKVLSSTIIPLNWRHDNNANDSLFIANIEKEIRTTSWLPSERGGKAVRDYVKIPIDFHITWDHATQPLMIKAEELLVYPRGVK